MRKHIFYNTVNFQPVTFWILFFRGIQTLQMRLSRKACFWWTQLLRPFCRVADDLQCSLMFHWGLLDCTFTSERRRMTSCLSSAPFILWLLRTAFTVWGQRETRRFVVQDLGCERVDVRWERGACAVALLLRADTISTAFSSAHSLQSKTPL